MTDDDVKTLNEIRARHEEFAKGTAKKLSDLSPEALRGYLQYPDQWEDRATLLRLLDAEQTERIENEGVIAVWRRRCNEAEAREEQLRKAAREACHAMEMNRWDWKSEASNDMQRGAHAALHVALAEVKP